MDSKSEEEEEEIIKCSLSDRPRRVSFLMDDNGNVLQTIFGDNYEREEHHFIGGGQNKMKLAYPHGQYNGARLEEIREQFDKLTKTKEEIKEWLSPLKNREELQRAGLILHDGKDVQPWFFGKITRRDSELLLRGAGSKRGTFLVRLSEKTACYTLSVLTGGGVSDCRHFLIISDPQFNDYKLLGSYQSFNSVTSLIHHHGHSAITKSGNECLLHVCPKPPNFTMIF